MDPTRLDAFARSLANHVTRRSALGGGLSGVLAVFHVTESEAKKRKGNKRKKKGKQGGQNNVPPPSSPPVSPPLSPPIPPPSPPNPPPPPPFCAGQPDGVPCGGGKVCQGSTCLCPTACCAHVDCGVNGACLANGTCAVTCSTAGVACGAAACICTSTSVEGQRHCAPDNLVCADFPQTCQWTTDCPVGHHCQGVPCGAGAWCVPLCET
jgi:hypothetical protein